MKTKEKDPLEIAHQLRYELEACMSDLAEGDENLADDYWNDEGVLSDMLGDRIYDNCGCLRSDDDKILAWEVANHMMEISHQALSQAALNFKNRQGLI